jgi:hypothetical protein
MRGPILPLAAAGLLGAFVGMSGTLLLAPRNAPAASARKEMPLKPSPARPARREEHRESTTPSAGLEGEAAAAAGSGGATSASEQEAVVAELNALRATAQAAQKQLGQARRRIAALEKDLERAAPGGEPRARHEF